jgi:hypothetical protein
MATKNLVLPPGIGHNEGPPPYDPAETFLTDAQVEKRWNVAAGYMSELRAQGVGPPHVRLSPRIIRYRLGVILTYEKSQEFGSNAAALEAAKTETIIETPAPAATIVRSKRRKSSSSRELESA